MFQLHFVNNAFESCLASRVFLLKVSAQNMPFLNSSIKLSEKKNHSFIFSRAIELEPLLLDAYWHRHLLFILQDKKKEALEDLTFILKHTKTHAGAYRSMAEIYKKQDDITMAIVNYTQAIKLNPRDHEAYFARAECYEKVCNRLLFFLLFNFKR